MSRLRSRPTEDYGYISRAVGNQQLLDTTRQGTYFDALRQQYDLHSLLDGLEHLVVGKHDSDRSQSSPEVKQQVSRCMSSLRKLREGIISSGRLDDFAIEVFETTVRYAILHNHSETYFPAMQYLQKTLYSRRSRGKSCRKELGQAKIGELLALHMCSINEYHEALEIGQAAKQLGDWDVTELIRTLMRGNWRKFRELRRHADLLQVHFLDKIAQDFSQSTLARVGAAYLVVDATWLSECCGEQWKEELRERGWKLDHSRVLIKQPRSHKS